MDRAEFELQLERYADLIVGIGLNLQPGQRLTMVDAGRNQGTPIQLAPLVRQVVIKAYQAGSPFVDVIWGDEQLKLIRFEHAPDESFDIFPEWLVDAVLKAGARGDALLNISAASPDLLSGQDMERIGRWQKTTLTHLEPFSNLIKRNAINWNLVSAPVEGWAAKVFPDLPVEGAVEQLWQVVFKMVRADQPDPRRAWERHLADLQRRCDYFNHKRYTALHYRAPGTDLRVGLPAGQLWKGGRVTSERGVPFVPNLPTEEVFTLADRHRVDGRVRSTKQLSYGGQLIEDFEFEFAEGRVVNFSARQGGAALQKLLDMDEGARRLGEVALVPHSSPVSQSGLLFHNTLFDENAASHLALGGAYRFTLRGGEAMSEAEFAAAGGNSSLIHVDFMVGCAEMEVAGVRADGQLEPVMRRGEWAFTV
ncbi:MAG: aminopeptidase [Anaerolineae bacterium UTCFX2]|jgi:aminopeptidase|nr:aminopeptidase [Anaerolineae bacterium]OQY88292.1 MAG: aminopeptidase [Anaerolineae bacterium UTCFX2]